MPGVNRLFMDVDGTFYPCERVSEQSEIMKIGHVDKGVEVEKAQYLLNIGTLTEQECINCFAFNFCTACCSHCDGNKELSRDKKLEYCETTKKAVLQDLQMIALLDEFGYDFTEG